MPRRIRREESSIRKNPPQRRETVGEHFGFGMLNALFMETIDPHLSRSMDDLMFGQQYTRVTDLAAFILKKCQIARPGNCH